MSEKVIVIDDDELVNESLVEILEILGFEIVKKGFNGKEAVELFEKHRPNHVLLDINMPQYDGFYAIENIRKIDPNARIIGLTGDLTEDTAQRLKSKNVLILYKPFDIEKLSEMLHDKSKVIV